MISTKQSLQDQCKAAYEASRELSLCDEKTKNNAIQQMAAAIVKEKNYIIEENKKDLIKGQENGLSKSLLDRLTLTEGRIQGIADSLKTIEALQDPVGEILESFDRPNGLKIIKKRVPLGVVGIIFEARPNVTADAIGLCIKTNNAVALRGSSSAYQSNLAIKTVMQDAAQKSGIPADAIQLLEDTSREGVNAFVKMKNYLSVIIPRGGASLIQNVVNSSTVPTIETGVGNCHTYVDSEVDIDMAIPIVVNAKTQRPSVCNTCETLLVHSDIAAEFLPKVLSILKEKKVEIRGCSKTVDIDPTIKAASSEDWDEEFLDLILAVKVVDSLDEAIKHIQAHGTLHSEAILSTNQSHITEFSNRVDAAAIVINASTRFVDGGEFGFGAEIGISTQKLHARGPMGLRELTTYKFIVEGQGQIRE